MAKNRKPRKGKTPRHGIALWENQQYWLPINHVIVGEYVSGALAAVSEDSPSEKLIAVIIDPIERAMTHFVGGYAKFIDYWVIIQGAYLYAHLLADALANQQYRIFDKDGYFPDDLNAFAVEQHLQPYREQFRLAESEYTEVIRAVGDRQKRTGKYGMTGDELNAVRAVIGGLQDLMTWVSVAMIYRAMRKCFANLTQIETSLQHKLRKA